MNSFLPYLKKITFFIFLSTIFSVAFNQQQTQNNECELTSTLENISDEKIKIIFYKNIISYLVDYEKYDRAGITPESCIILYDPIKINIKYYMEIFYITLHQSLKNKNKDISNFFVTISVSELKKIGVQKFLLTARTTGPLVIYINDFDVGGFHREDDAAALHELQMAMSIINRDKSKKVIVIMGTTNLEKIDPSLLEMGKFNKLIDLSIQKN